MRPFRLAFSPDADDLFMFLPLLTGLLNTQGRRYEPSRYPTEALNALADSPQKPDVCAVSAAALPKLADRFLVLPHGASIGRGYGPVVVAKVGRHGRPLALSDLAGKRVAIPGLTTTAHLVLSLLSPGYEPVVVPITPYAAVFDALEVGTVDAALLIHEGRLTYLEDPTLYRVAELGESWHALTGLPLVLGVNVIARDLGHERIAAVSDDLRRSIAYSLAHRDETIQAIMASGAREEAKLDVARLDRYLAMYANEDSSAFASDALLGLGELFARGKAAGLLESEAFEVSS